MRADYLLKRFGVFVLIVWLAATLNFFLPRLSGQDPVRATLLQQAQLGGYVQAGLEAMVKEYERRFGLDKPLWVQYVTYLSDVSRFNFNYSISNYPRTVNEIIAEAIPWTIGLLGTTTALSFTIGTLLGALLAWPGAPRWMRVLMPPLWALHAIPFFLLGLVLMYVFAFRIQLLPMFGGYSPGAFPALTLTFVGDVIAHAILPALSIVLADVGFWALAMRGMMITVQGEDYMTLAEAKGLNPGRIFLRYGVRNAILPQITSLALSMGRVVSGAILVEIVFSYPGVGNLLYQSIRSFDYFVIYGVAFMVIVAIGLATLILDLLLPVLDPRISYGQT